MASDLGWAGVLRLFEPYLAWHETVYLKEVCVDMANEWYEWYIQKKKIAIEESIVYAFVGSTSADWVMAHPDFGFILRRLVTEAMVIDGMFENEVLYSEASGSDSD